MKFLKFTTVIVTIIAAFLCVFHIAPAYAEDAEIDESEQVSIDSTSHGYIDVSAKLGTQIPFFQTIPVNVTFTPKVEGRAAYIILVTSSGLKTQNTPMYVDFEKDETITRTVYLAPQRSGQYSIGVDIIVYGNDINYGDSTSVTATIDNNLVVKETSMLYYLYTVLIVLLIITAIIAFIVFMLKYGKTLVNNIKTWFLNDPKYRELKNQQEIESFYQKLHSQGTSTQARQPSQTPVQQSQKGSTPTPSI